MPTTLFVALLLTLVVVVYAGLSLSAYYRMRGRRVIVCPETGKPAGVKVDKMHAAMTALWDSPDVRLCDCSRWPERADCNQACTGQIVAEPEETRVDSILAKWYANKNCAMCRRSIGPVTGPQKPGLYNVATRQTVTWEEIPAEAVPVILDTHLPVCANCQLADSFRRQFPDLVVDRDETSKRDSLVH
jgi:hypothetical protein